MRTRAPLMLKAEPGSERRLRFPPRRCWSPSQPACPPVLLVKTRVSQSQDWPHQDAPVCTTCLGAMTIWRPTRQTRLVAPSQGVLENAFVSLGLSYCSWKMVGKPVAFKLCPWNPSRGTSVTPVVIQGLQALHLDFHLNNFLFNI